MMTLVELKERLAAHYDECQLLDLLEINSYELVDLLSDKIEEKMEILLTEVEELEEDYGYQSK